MKGSITVPQTPWFLWVLLTAASVVVGGAMLWIAFGVVDRRQKQQRGFEVKTTTGVAAPAAAPGEKTSHG